MFTAIRLIFRTLSLVVYSKRRENLFQTIIAIGLVQLISQEGRN